MGKTYYIRKVEGGGSPVELWKKNWVLVSFPHSATPLGWFNTELPKEASLWERYYRLEIAIQSRTVSMVITR